jgi:hypothetical protein
MPDIYMKAPDHVSQTILGGGHVYDVSDDRVVKVKHEDHVASLLRFGYSHHTPKQQKKETETDIDSMDEAALVSFIEERGGEVEAKWSLKKLRRIAKELLEE